MNFLNSRVGQKVQNITNEIIKCNVIGIISTSFVIKIYY